MKNKILKTEQEYNEAIERIYELIHSSEHPIEPDTAKGEELELLSLLVELYERKHYPIKNPTFYHLVYFQGDLQSLLTFHINYLELFLVVLSLLQLHILHQFLLFQCF